MIKLPNDENDDYSYFAFTISFVFLSDKCFCSLERYCTQTMESIITKGHFLTYTFFRHGFGVITGYVLVILLMFKIGCKDKCHNKKYFEDDLMIRCKRVFYICVITTTQL